MRMIWFVIMRAAEKSAHITEMGMSTRSSGIRTKNMSVYIKIFLKMA